VFIGRYRGIVLTLKSFCQGKHFLGTMCCWILPIGLQVQQVHLQRSEKRVRQESGEDHHPEQKKIFLHRAVQEQLISQPGFEYLNVFVSWRKDRLNTRWCQKEFFVPGFPCRKTPFRQNPCQMRIDDGRDFSRI